MLIMSIMFQDIRCKNCSAPLSAGATFVSCPYCGSEFYLPPLPGFRIPAPRAYPHPSGLGTVRVGDHLFRIHGKLGEGSHCSVFLARRERALTEMVVLKVAGAGGEEALRREWETVHKLRPRQEFLSHLIPAPVLWGMADRGSHTKYPTAAYRWMPGFHFTLLDAKRQYPEGVDPKAVVWIWNRLLDLLDCLHSLGYGHHAVRPEHVLLHPRDHGATLCGWSRAARPVGDDLADCGRSIASVLGSDAPPALTRLALASERYEHAHLLKEELQRVARACFGPPAFHPFSLSARGTNAGT